MKDTAHAIRRVWVAIMVITCLLFGSALCAAEPEQGAMFSQDPEDNPKQIAGHKYPATVIIGEEFSKTRGVKIAMAPHDAPDSCWIMSASFRGSGKKTRTVFLGMDKRMREKYDLLLLSYQKGKKVPKEGKIPVDDLGKEGFEEIGSIEVERTE